MHLFFWVWLQGAVIAGSAAVAAAVTGYQFLDVNTKFQLASSTGPLIRMLDAETAHRVGILAARFGLFPRETRPDPESLKVQLWGRTFPNPMGKRSLHWPRLCVPSPAVCWPWQPMLSGATPPLNSLPSTGCKRPASQPRAAAVQALQKRCSRTRTPLRTY